MPTVVEQQQMPPSLGRPARRVIPSQVPHDIDIHSYRSTPVPSVAPVPPQPQADSDDVSHAFWFRPLAAETALLRLLANQPLGTFAVRQSKRFEGCFVLVLAEGGPHVRQILIECAPQGFHLEHSKNYFRSLAQLVLFYSMPNANNDLGLLLRPDQWPVAGEIVRPVVGGSRGPAQVVRRGHPTPNIPPPAPTPKVIEPEVYTYETEQVETELVFDVQEIEELIEEAPITTNPHQQSAPSVPAKVVARNLTLYNKARSETPSGKVVIDPAVVHEEIKTMVHHIFECHDDDDHGPTMMQTLPKEIQI